MALSNDIHTNAKPKTEYAAQINSSNGTAYTDIDGLVLFVEALEGELGDDLRNTVKYDLAECDRFWGVGHQTEYDILDVGCSFKDGTTDIAEEFHRSMIVPSESTWTIYSMVDGVPQDVLYNKKTVSINDYDEAIRKRDRLNDVAKTVIQGKEFNVQGFYHVRKLT